ncbi:DUF885 family protein [Parasegetibacter sp. NRK P23]|uniref:DUF885 family protein n=1 Tax=Parasegetibacter sp. NRK P23 TaxID=2942999 RepID=UPI0020445981|nr:DUF885 family protein [Parasegetibacter sp. NRK P23]MCM5526843.1 DUF885 domain-containing protein [Parasegetibacter sp. NRK P23]
MIKRFAIATWLVVSGLPAATFAQTVKDYVPCQVMPDILNKFRVDENTLSRFYTVEGSPERIARMEQLYNDYGKQLATVKFSALPQECKVDYILFKRDLAERMRLLAIDKKEIAGIAQWFSFTAPIYDLEKGRRRGASVSGEKIAADFAKVEKQVKDLDEKLKQTKNIGVLEIRRAESMIQGVKRALWSVNEFYNGYDPMYTWWVPKTYEKLNDALTGYGRTWQSKMNNDALQQDKSGIVGKPIGKEEIEKQLAYEMMPYTAEELIEVANKEFAWCDKEMLKASAELGFGNNWKAALEKVKESYVPAGKQPELILRLYNESVDFIKKKDLITLPPLAEETWGMIMMTPERQLVNPFFTGGREISISYPTNTMSYDDRLMSMRGNNPHFSRATVHHELLAGHNLQYFMNSRYRNYRNFQTPFWTEGWALYWEFLLWEQGFPQGPEDRIGMLFWRMHRCARIIFSLNYHLGKWTPQQCIDFLVDRVGHERANAEGEVRRSFVGGYSPLYQLAYMMGGLQFFALKKELVDTKKLSHKDFHDAIISLNAMPVEMIRAILTNQPLKEDHKSAWRFYK